MGCDDATQKFHASGEKVPENYLPHKMKKGKNNTENALTVIGLRGRANAPIG